MRNLMKLRILVGTVLVLSASAAGSASAESLLTASATGTLAGHALNSQLFWTNGGGVKCNIAETTGAIASTATSEQHVTVTYRGCIAFGFISTDITPATYLFTTHTEGSTLVNTVHILNTITITPTGAGCTQTVEPQTVGTVDFINEAGGYVVVKSTVSGIVYKSSGGICGAPGSNGSYEGESTIERVGGGSLQFDA